MKTFLRLVWTVLFFSIPLGAQVQLSFQGNPGRALTLAYSLTAPVEVTKSVTIRHRGPATSWFFTLSPGQNSGGNPLDRQTWDANSNPLFYQILDASGNILTNSQGFSGSFPAKTGGFQSITVSYRVVLQIDQFPWAGSFTDLPQIQLYQGVDTTGILSDSADLPLTVTMQQVVDMRLVQRGGSYTSGVQDFVVTYPILTTGSVQEADLLVRTNVPYSVEMQSQNGGFLQHLSLPSTIPYQLIIDGNAVTFLSTTPIQVLLTQPPTGVAGQSYAISTSLPLNDLLPDAGQYQDVISITIVPN